MCGLEFDVARINFVVSSLINISKFIVLAFSSKYVDKKTNTNLPHWDLQWATSNCNKK